VLPAVEVMQALAGAVREVVPDAGVLTMREVRFDRFLPIPPEAEFIEAFAEIETIGGCQIRAELLTRRRARASGISRVMRHASLIFGGGTPIRNAAHPKDGAAAPPQAFEIPADRLYRELVPFGPAYRNILENAMVWPSGGTGTVIAAPHDTLPGPLGSPFPLDAAFHIACVFCQRFAGVVGFPVGMDHREIRIPTRPGGFYRAEVLPRRIDSTLMVFDIALLAMDSVPCERVSGVRMRDVSGGLLKPPAWVTAQADPPHP